MGERFAVGVVFLATVVVSWIAFWSTLRMSKGNQNESLRDEARRTGLLLHPTSLPGSYGTGDIGKQAHQFVDWCAAHDVTMWQVLPLVPPGPGFSPYSTPSASAGSPWLINLDVLRDQGWLNRDDLNNAPTFDVDTLDPAAMINFRRPLLEKAAATYLSKAAGRDEVQEFLEQASWAREHARFFAIREEQSFSAWTKWPKELRDRAPDALTDVDNKLAPRILFHGALQLFFDQQWRALRDHANACGIQIVGDVPIYVDHDSVEVWTHREAFLMDEDGACDVVAGVPPDPFSDTGQRWGNPLYDWEAQAKTGFSFWIQRLRRSLELHDVVRIDHFRGLAAYWEVPADAPDARSGRWVPGPGKALFDALEEALGPLPLIAEDLGIIDAPVEALRDAVKLPGMKVLQFAFGEDATNPYLPHHHVDNCVVYTGTHDTPTLLGFWESTSEATRDHVRHYYGIDGHDVVWDLNRSALASCAKWAILPLQDLFALDDDARMNRPGLSEGNWIWRIRSEAFDSGAGARLAYLSALYGRSPVKEKE